MNITLIILGVIIAILIYVLWYYYSPGNSSVLSSKANLNATNPPITSLNSPTNTRYGYGIWVYVNSWNNQNDKIIFSRDKNIKLRLDKSKPSLYCDITMSDGTTESKTLITDNFPLQKWVFVIVSVDNQFLDCYLDGKLVKSTRLYQHKGAKGHEGFIEGWNTWGRNGDGSSRGNRQPGSSGSSTPSSGSSSGSSTPSSGSSTPSSGSSSPSSGSSSPSSGSSSPSSRASGSSTPASGSNNVQQTILIPAVPPSETTPVILGSNKPFDAVVASFTRWSSPVDPQTAWNAYTGGNTPTGLGKLGNLGSYGANLSILQNNSEYSKITLF